MRIQGSKVLDAVARELGAIPQIMAFSELYQALQTGVVDGEDNVPSNILDPELLRGAEISDRLLSWAPHLRARSPTRSSGTDCRRMCGSRWTRAVKESTDFFNETAAKDNADALEKIKASGKLQVHVLTAGGEAGLDRQADAGPQRDAEPLRQGLHREDLQGLRLHAGVLTGTRRCSTGVEGSRMRAPARSHPRSARRMDHRHPDRRRHLLTFVAVVHRYGASNSVALATWAKAHGLAGSGSRRLGLHALTSINLSWAQELATYMFVWMAKFGAALGVRTGIHVGVDVFVNAAPALVAQAGDRFCAAVRRPVHRRHRHAGRDLCL